MSGHQARQRLLGRQAAARARSSGSSSASSEAAALTPARLTVTGEIPDSHRWDLSPKIRFAPNSPLERERFEPPVPLLRVSLDSRGMRRGRRSIRVVSKDVVPFSRGRETRIFARVCGFGCASRAQAAVFPKTLDRSRSTKFWRNCDPVHTGSAGFAAIISTGVKI